MRKAITLWVGIFGVQMFAHAQQMEPLGLLEAGLEDAQNYMRAYLRPVGEGWIAGSSGGWANTGATHKILGFDIKGSVAAAIIPSGREFFRVDQQDFQRIRLEDPSLDLFPTLIGPNEDGPGMLIYDEHQNELHRMNGFSGTGLSDKLEISRSIVPLPILQAGLGVDKGTDLKLRYIPHRNFGDVKVHGWGLGIQHNLTQHMNAGNWDMAVLVGYNRLGAEYQFSDEEDKLLATQLSSLTSQLILSKRLAILTLFATGGYHSGKVNFDLLGSYEISTEEILWILFVSNFSPAIHLPAWVPR